MNFVVNNLTAHVIEEKLDPVLDKLKCAAKPYLALEFIPKNTEDWQFRYFYFHEDNALMKQSKPVSNKDEMAKSKEILKKTDVLESGANERSNTKWKFFKLTNLIIFAALLRDIPMGCKDVLLLESLLKNHKVNCLTYEQNIRKPYKDNLCLFRALALHLHVKERLAKETSKLFSLFLVNSTNPDASKFQGICMDDIPSRNLERHLARCSERVKHMYTENVYQLRETLFDKLDPFDNQKPDDQKLFLNLAVFDFESICIPQKDLKTPRRQLGLLDMFQN